MACWSASEIELLEREVDFAKGLVAAIARDAGDSAILMLGFQNEEAFRQTLLTGQMHYWSRSRGRLWRKGETTGHVQVVKAVRLDCDGDTLLYDVVQNGPGACHTGARTCFFRVNRPGSDEWTKEE